jgi:hypothetical protein
MRYPDTPFPPLHASTRLAATLRATTQRSFIHFCHRSTAPRRIASRRFASQRRYFIPFTSAALRFAPHYSASHLSASRRVATTFYSFLPALRIVTRRYAAPRAATHLDATILFLYHRRATPHDATLRNATRLDATHRSYFIAFTTAPPRITSLGNASLRNA